MKPLLRVAVPPQTYREGFPGSLDYTTGAQTTADALGKATGSDNGPWVCAIVVRADDANAATLAVGGPASATYLLAAGEFIAIDVPPGIVMDLSKFSVNGFGTSGLIAHFFYVSVVP